MTGVLQWLKDHWHAAGFAAIGMLVVYLLFALEHAQAQARVERIARQNVEAQLDTTKTVYQDSLRVAERKLIQGKPKGPVSGGTAIATVGVTVQPAVLTIPAGPPQLHGPAEAVFTADTNGVELKAHVWWGPAPSAVLSATFKPIPLTYQLRCDDQGAPVVDIAGPRDIVVDAHAGTITPDACNRGGAVVLGIRLPSLPVTAGLIAAGAALVLAVQRVVHF